jgi:hypothetical protein
MDCRLAAGMGAVDGGSGSDGGRWWFLKPRTVVILLLPVAVPSLIRHSYRRLHANQETADALEDVVSDFVADRLLPDYVPDALADAIGEFVADAIVDLVTDDDDDGDDADEDGRTTLSSSSCSLSDDEFANDPDMRTMVFDIGYGPQEFRAYVQPDVSTFYRDDGGSPRGGGGSSSPRGRRNRGIPASPRSSRT